MFFCSVLSLVLSDPVQEKNVLQSWLDSIYVAKLLNILPCLAQKTMLIVFEDISYILVRPACALNVLKEFL